VPTPHVRIEYPDLRSFVRANRQHFLEGHVWVRLPGGPPPEGIDAIEVAFAREQTSVVVRGSVLGFEQQPDAEGGWLVGFEIEASERERMLRRIWAILEGGRGPDSRRVPRWVPAAEVSVQVTSKPTPDGEPEPEPRAAPSAPPHARHADAEHSMTLASFAKLTLAEQARLALKGGRTARQLVIRQQSVPLLRQLMQNPALTDSEVVEIARMRETGREILEAIADRKDWMANDAVRLALLENVSTPMPLALRMVPVVPRRDLRRMYKKRSLRGPIEAAIRRLLEGRG
jgi:hypothetical protein